MLEALVLLVRHWRILAPLMIIIIIVAALAHARHEHERAEAAKIIAAAATRQARANAALVQITDTLHRREAQTHAAADQEIADVQTLAGAQTPLDPARRARLCAALDRLFDHGPGGCEPDPAADPARTLPPADQPARHPG